MFFSSSFVEFGVVIELIIDQLDLIRIKLEKNKLNRIDEWVLEQEKSFSQTDLSENLLFNKLTKLLAKDQSLNEENFNDSKGKSFSVACYFNAESKTLPKIQSGLKQSYPEKNKMKHEKISLGNTVKLMFKSMDLFNDNTLITNLEQKNYLELIILIYLLKDLKTEILNQGTYEIFYHNIIIFRLQNSLTAKIVNDLRNNSRNVRLLKQKINFAKYYFKNEIKNMNLSKRNEVSIKSRLLFKNKILGGYCKRWKENNFVKIQKIKEISFKKIQKSIENTNYSIQIENQAHGLMMLIINREIASNVSKMDKLEALYYTSIDKIQTKLNKIKNIFELQREKLKNLQENFEYKQNIVSNYNKEKYKDDKIIEALKIISNWWLSVKLRIK